MKWYARNVGDYGSATRHLDLMEHGAYTLLLDAYYATERCLPANEKQVLRICSSKGEAEDAAVLRVLHEFFVLTPDGWVQHKSRAEIEKTNEIREKRAAAGKKGGEANAKAIAVAKNKQAAKYPQPQELPTPSLRSGVGRIEDVVGSDVLPLKAKPSTKRIRASATTAPTTETWEAYSAAYVHRYRAEPVRNRTSNALMAKVVERLGAEEAPPVAAFFLTHNGGLYVAAMHAPNLLLRDCEKLRTEWATRRTVTQTQARQADRTQALGNTFAELREEPRNGTEG